MKFVTDSARLIMQWAPSSGIRKCGSVTFMCSRLISHATPSPPRYSVSNSLCSGIISPRWHHLLLIQSPTGLMDEFKDTRCPAALLLVYQHLLVHEQQALLSSVACFRELFGDIPTQTRITTHDMVKTLGLSNSMQTASTIPSARDQNRR